METTNSVLESLESEFLKIIEQYRKCFKRNTGLEVGKSYVKGLLSKIERKNSWQLAEGTESTTPYKYQHLRGCCELTILCLFSSF